MRGGGGVCGVSASEYSCANGAQINFGDLTPYLTYDQKEGGGTKNNEYLVMKAALVYLQYAKYYTVRKALKIADI
jgi:hypothetical protein